MSCVTSTRSSSECAARPICPRFLVANRTIGNHSMVFRSEKLRFTIGVTLVRYDEEEKARKKKNISSAVIIEILLLLLFFFLYQVIWTSITQRRSSTSHSRSSLTVSHFNSASFLNSDMVVFLSFFFPPIDGVHFFVQTTDRIEEPNAGHPIGNPLQILPSPQSRWTKWLIISQRRL